MEEHAMKTWIGAAIVTTALSFGTLSFETLVLGGPMAVSSTAGVQTGASPTAGLPVATDVTARRRYRHHYRYAYRPYDRPHYYDRPYSYRPYPYNAPVPFFLGLGFGP